MVADFTKDEDWEILHLGGIRMPGVARVEVDMPTGVDIQKARGKKKARLVDRGVEPAKLSIELELMPDELDELAECLNTLRPRARSAGQKYLTIYHPAAGFFGINQVMIGDMGAPHPVPGGTFLFRFEAIEHVAEPAKVKKAKPAAGKEDEQDWGGVQGLINKANERPSSAVEENFSAPEDVTNFTAQSGQNIFVPEPTMSGGG